MPELVYQVEDCREQNAQEKTHHEGKIESELLAAIDVTGTCPSGR